MSLRSISIFLCIIFFHQIGSADQLPTPLLKMVADPPADPASRGWLLRDAAEGAAYLAHRLVSNDVTDQERKDVQEKIQATLDDLINDRLSDGTWWKPNNAPQGDPNLNRFVLTALLDTLWTLRQYSVFEQSWNQWASRIRSAMDFQIKVYRGQVSWDLGEKSPYIYPNQDILYALSSAISAKIFYDKIYSDEAEKAIQSIERNQMPGGGWHYIGSENESPIYHALVQAVLARYIDITNDARARLMLKRSAEYWRIVLSAQGVAEAWSDVWWKQNWLSIPSDVVYTSSVAAEDAELAAIAKTMATFEQRNPSKLMWAHAYTYFWKKKEAPTPLQSANRKLTMDPDRSGVHGRYDDWYFGLTKGRGLRNTFVGAMFSRYSDAAPLVAAFRGAQIIVKFGDKDRYQYSLSQKDDKTEITLQENHAFLSAEYLLQPNRINSDISVQDVDSPWKVRQIWAAGASGLIGTVELKAIRDTAASAVIGRLLLGPCAVVSEDNSTWRCGVLKVRVFELWGEAKVMPIGAAYPSQVDHWDGIEWKTRPQDVKKDDVYRYGVWVGPVGSPIPEYLSFLSEDAGWVARWKNGKTMQVGIVNDHLKITESQK